MVPAGDRGGHEEHRKAGEFEDTGDSMSRPNLQLGMGHPLDQERAACYHPCRSPIFTLQLGRDPIKRRGVSRWTERSDRLAWP